MLYTRAGPFRESRASASSLPICQGMARFVDLSATKTTLDLLARYTGLSHPDSQPPRLKPRFPLGDFFYCFYFSCKD